MRQVMHDSDEPFSFSWGGSLFIIPPRSGGTWRVDGFKHIYNKKTKKKDRVLQFKKLSDEPKRAYIDIPDDACVTLFMGRNRQRHQGRVKLMQDVLSSTESEIALLKKEKEQLLHDRAMIEERIANYEKVAKEDQ